VDHLRQNQADGADPRSAGEPRLGVGVMSAYDWHVVAATAGRVVGQIIIASAVFTVGLGAWLLVAVNGEERDD
jgi:hypothetical protein